MRSRFNLVRSILLFIFLICTVNCSQKRAANHSELKEYINTISIIDTHEHQHNPDDFPTQNIALKIFRENAINEFKLSERLGRDF